MSRVDRSYAFETARRTSDHPRFARIEAQRTCRTALDPGMGLMNGRAEPRRPPWESGEIRAGFPDAVRQIVAHGGSDEPQGPA